jgi:hypothetical protein
MERNDFGIFPINQLRAVELYNTRRADRIEKGKKIVWVIILKVDFIALVNSTQYIMFPVFRLQESFRRVILGRKYWFTIQRKLEERELKKKIEKKQVSK